MISTEIRVFNAVRRHLRDVDATVLQLVAPGHQAPFGVTMATPAGRKTRYPDVLVLKDGHLLVGEMKPRYSVADHAKVVALTTHGAPALLALVRRLRPRETLTEVSGLLCHFQRPCPQLDDVGQWVFGGDSDAIEIVNAPF